MDNDKINISGFILLGIFLTVVGSLLIVFKYYVISTAILFVAIALIIVGIMKRKQA